MDYKNDINRLAAMAFGWILVAVGIIGFFWDPILGLFEVDALHNVAHGLIGVALLVGAYWRGGLHARAFNATVGVVYLLLAAAGLLAPGFVSLIIETNAADNWLHIGLAVALIGVAFVARTTTTRRHEGAIR